MIATLNIGLNNNPYGNGEVIDLLQNKFDVLWHGVDTGQYEGEVEPTLVVLIDSDYARTSKFIEIIEQLATVMTQNCIAVSTHQFDILVYSQNYQGERYKFNPKYFIEI